MTINVGWVRYYGPIKNIWAAGLTGESAHKVVYFDRRWQAKRWVEAAVSRGVYNELLNDIYLVNSL